METLFQKIKLINTNEPELLGNESILYKADNVTIYDGDQKSNYANGLIILSNYRIIWINKDIALSLMNQLVLSVDPLTTGLMGLGSSPKILITLSQRSFRLSFHSGKRDEFLKLYKQTLLSKQQPPKQQQQTQPIQQQQHNSPPPAYNNNNQQTQQPPQYNSYNPYQQSSNVQQQNQQPPQYNSYSPYQQQQPQQQSYVQQQQQQIPQYQQQSSPPNYSQHMQQTQSSSPPLYNNYHSTQQPLPPPSYLQHLQQQQQQGYQSYQSYQPYSQQPQYNASIPSQPPQPNYKLQNFINTPNSIGTNNNYTPLSSSPPLTSSTIPTTTSSSSNINSYIPSTSTNTSFTSNAGIGGIINQMNKKTQENDKLLAESFSDLNVLMEKAKDMVNLSEKLKSTLDKKAGGTGSTEEEDEFRSFLLQMGIESPVTKKTAKSKYHNELSKQLSDWIINKNILSKQSSSAQSTGGIGGNNEMITLSDLYCIFNRARGIELISPDDLYRACLLFESLDLPLRLRKFDSGVMVVQSKFENDDQVAKQILDIISERGPLSAFDLAKISSISIHLAKDQLLTSETLGKLCRDETIEGNILYHKNIFVDF